MQNWSGTIGNILTSFYIRFTRWLFLNCWRIEWLWKRCKFHVLVTYHFLCITLILNVRWFNCRMITTMILDLKHNYDVAHKNCRRKKHGNCNAFTVILYFKCSEKRHLAKRAQMYPIELSVYAASYKFSSKSENCLICIISFNF